jgi:hypothetical protein
LKKEYCIQYKEMASVASPFLSIHPDELDGFVERASPSPATTMESQEVVIETAQDILLAAFREDVFRIDIKDIFTEEQIRSLQMIEGEPIHGGAGVSARGDHSHSRGRGGGGSGSGTFHSHSHGHSHGHGQGYASSSSGNHHSRGRGGGGISRGNGRAMRVQIKKKPESFDDAIRQQLISELNKVSDLNYDIILKAIQSHYSRFAPDSKEWVLQRIIENGTIQHPFAEVYMRLFKAILDEHSKDDITSSIAEKLMNNLLDTHCDVLMKEVSNGETYDDFCEANKLKLSRIGISKVVGEGINIGVVPVSRIGDYTNKLLETLYKVRLASADSPKEATENRVTCVLSLFDTVGKTKAGKSGFVSSMASIQNLLDEEKKTKLLTSKARFAIMDLLEKYPSASPVKSS